MTEATATLDNPSVEDLTETEAETTGAPTTEEDPKWLQERKLHGRDSVVKFIGNLTRDAVCETEVEDGKFPYIWGGVALGRGEGQPSSFHTYYIYGVKDSPEADDATRPTTEELQALAAQLKSGDRIRLKGSHDLRPINNDLYKQVAEALGYSGSMEADRDGKQVWVVDEAGKQDKALREFFFSGRSSIRIFVRRADLDLAGTYNAKGNRPITLLPRIGEDSSDPDDIF